MSPRFLLRLGPLCDLGPLRFFLFPDILVPYICHRSGLASLTEPRVYLQRQQAKQPRYQSNSLAHDIMLTTALCLDERSHKVTSISLKMTPF